MRTGRACALFAAALLAFAAQAAEAASTQTYSATGTAKASVVDPTAIEPVAALRFGTFGAPTTAGTITIATDSTASATGGMVGGLDFVQDSEGRGAGSFKLYGGDDLAFNLFLPNRIDLSNGTTTMQVRNFTANVKNGKAALDSNGHFNLSVGGTLSVSANQMSGYYSGTFDVVVLYL